MAFDKDLSTKEAVVKCLKGWSQNQRQHNAQTLYEGLRTGGVTFENDIEYRAILGQMIDAGTLIVESGSKMGDFDRLWLSLNPEAWLSAAEPKT